MSAPRRPTAPLFAAVVAFLVAVALPALVRAGTIVHFDTSLGLFDVELYDAGMPTTVANFLNYVNAGSYSSTIIHRSTTYNPADIQISQGGGYVLSGNSLNAVTTRAPIVFESGTYSNVRGTIAMARGADPNSATSQFYFNVRNNPALDGNYAVFGTVVGAGGLAVLDAIGAVPVYDCTVQLGAAFSELPLTAPSLVTSSLVVVNRVQAVPEPSIMALAAFGLTAAWFVRRRKPSRNRRSGSGVLGFCRRAGG